MNEVAAAPAALAEINRLWTIARVFSNTAHQLNNVLQVVSGNAELIESRELEPAVRKRVATIRHESARAAAMLVEVVSYARNPEAGTCAFDLAALAASAAGMRTASCNRRRIAVQIEAAAVPVRARANANLVMQALLDVLLVAEDVAEGGAGPRLTITPAADGGMATITIVVTNAGHPAPTLPSAIAAPRSVDDVTNGLQMWAADYLLREQGGTLVVEESSGTLRLIVSVPTA